MTSDLTTINTQWRGIHHVALATPDLDRTIAFYRDILGMSITPISPSPRGRHCIVLAKVDDPDTWGFHFFEREAPQAPSASYPLLHIAFRLVDDAAANALRQRLRENGSEITEIPELGSFVFNDNNGLMLEATWPKT